MTYITDAAREYAKKMAKDDDHIDIDQRIIDLEKSRILEDIKYVKFPEVEADDWLTLGPGQDASAFVTFSKDDEQYIKYILQKYDSMIAHVKDNVYLILDGPNDKIESSEGAYQLIKENVLHIVPTNVGEKYVAKLTELYGE